MAANSQGIATLLDAEKEASKVVSKAREYRTQRVKDARGEATKEIEAYKAKKEKEFAEFEASRKGSNTSSQSSLDEETAKKITEIKARFKKEKDAVVKTLLERVVEVKPVLHVNYKQPA